MVSFLEILDYKLAKSMLKILILFLTIITGIRYFNGTDYETYSIIFENIKEIEDYNYLEYLFRLIVVINNKFLNFNYNFIIFSILNFIFLYLALRKIEYPFIALFIYLNLFWIPYSFNGIRQGIAMNIFLFFLLESSKYKWFLIFVATGIHKVSFPIFTISESLMLIKKKIRYKNIVFLILGILFFVFSDKTVKFLSLFIPKLAFYSANFKYLSMKGLIFRIITTIIFMYFEQKNKNDIFYRKFFNIHIFGMLEYLLLFDSYMFGTRINMFFRIIELILYSRIFYNLKDKKQKIAIFLFLSIFWGSIFYKDISSTYNSPYKINPYFMKG